MFRKGLIFFYCAPRFVFAFKLPCKQITIFVSAGVPLTNVILLKARMPPSGLLTNGLAYTKLIG
jgi:hypothetical protein